MFNKISLSRGSIASLLAIFVGAGRRGGGNTPTEAFLWVENTSYFVMSQNLLF